VRVLFIYPNKVMVTRMPLGISYLSAYLKRDGHEVKMFDTTFMKCGDIQNDDKLREASLQVRNPDFNKYGLVEKETDVFDELEREIESFKPELIAISVVDPNYNFGLELLARAKKKNKNILTIIGGPTATYAPDEVIAEDSVDIVCIGEGEEAMGELCQRMQNGDDIKNIKNLWIKENGKAFKNEVRSLINVDELLYPDWDMFDQRHLIRPLGGKMYRMGIFSMTRGCLFRCTYCSNLSLSRLYAQKGKYYRIKKPEHIVKEIALYKEKYNLNFVFFTDDLFPLHSSEMMDEFCSLYKKHVELPFNISLHPELVREDDFAKIVDAGCRNICVGLESGSPEIRKMLLQRSYKNEKIIEVFKLARKYKVRSSSFNMIGLPHETREDIFATIDLNKKARPTTCTLTFFHPYRGSALRDLCIENKFYDASREKEYESAYREESCLTLSSISTSTLRGLFKTFQLYVKLPKFCYPLIRIAEGESYVSKGVHYMLKQIFYLFTAKESAWNFTTDNQSSATKEN